MTAEKAGLLAEGFWATLKRVRDHWVLLVFLATSLFWMRDLYTRFIDLPVHVTELRTAIDELRVSIARLEARPGAAVPVRAPALVFPGVGHDIDDGRPGGWVTARYNLAHQVRPECRPGTPAAYMIDAGGRWTSVRLAMTGFPLLDRAQPVAFAVRIDPQIATGRTQFELQVPQHCGTHTQVDVAPRLQFRVLREEDPEPAN